MARSLIAIPTQPAIHPRQERRVSAETIDRRNRFIATQESNIPKSDFPPDNASFSGYGRLSDPSKNTTGAERISTQAELPQKSELSPPPPTSKNGKDGSENLFYSSSNLTQVIKEDLKGYMSSNNSLMDPKKAIPEELNGFMVSTNSLLTTTGDHCTGLERKTLDTPVDENPKISSLHPRSDVPLRSALKKGDREILSNHAGYSPVGSALKVVDNAAGQDVILSGHTISQIRAAPREENDDATKYEKADHERAADNKSDPSQPGFLDLTSVSALNNTSRRTSVKCGTLADYTAPQQRHVTKANKGASMYSSIDTFNLSSGTLGVSNEDLGNLEGFGGTTPSSKKDVSTSEVQDDRDEVSQVATL